MEQKDIDRLFQENLKDIEITPHPKVWNAIEQKLQKKKRRVLPIWWFSSGVAAACILGLFFFLNTKDKQHKNNFPVITKEATKENNQLKETQKINNLNSLTPILKEETLKPKYNNNSVVTENDTNNSEEKTVPSTTIASDEAIVTDDLKKDTNSVNTHKEHTNKSSSDKIVAENNLKQNTTNTNKEINSPFIEVVQKNKKYSSNEIIVENNLKPNTTNINKASEEKNVLKNTKPTDEILAANTLKQNVNNSNTEKKNTPVENILKNKNSSDKVIAEKKDNTLNKDFIVEVNTTKENSEEEENLEKWAISPVVGIIKSNSFSKTSPLDEGLSNNDFSGQNTFSFGVNITYKISKRWAIKSGVQLQKTGFTTNDVSLTSSSFLNITSLDNVDSNSELTNEFEINSNSDEESAQGNLLQNYSYIEIPLEIKYAFFSSRKINTHIIAGFSSLILNENTISGESSNFNTNIGSANNLNTLNFSGNLGFDIDFKLSKKINLNINPMFKAQLNTFSENANGFKPYNIGVYSGIIYHF